MRTDSMPFHEYLLGIVLLIALFLPHTSIALLMVNPILCILLFRYYKPHEISEAPISRLFLIFTLFLSFVINTFVGSVSFKATMTVLNLGLLLFCFPIISDYRIRNVFFYIAIGYILVSQFAMFLYIPFLSNLLDTLYPITEEKENYFAYVAQNADFESISGFRLSGLFRNPNQCARMVSIIFASFLLENKETGFKKLLPFIALAGISILLTGSRTGLFIFVSILIFALWNNNYVTRSEKIYLFIFMLFGVVYLFSSGNEFRGLKIDEGIDNSAGSKYTALLDYLNHNTGFLSLLFGNFDPDHFVATNSNVINSLDSEYGYLIFNYGFIGFFAYIVFFVLIYKHMSRYEKIILIPMLWIVSSTMLLAYRPAFLFIFLLSKYYTRINLNEYNDY